MNNQWINFLLQFIALALMVVMPVTTSFTSYLDYLNTKVNDLQSEVAVLRVTSTKQKSNIEKLQELVTEHIIRTHGTAK